MTDIEHLQDVVLAYYRQSGRHDLPWRQPARNGDFDPYAILVSELMLQQTQVLRVIPKFSAFMAAYPSLAKLAIAPLADVLKQWSGLGYNRRAKFLLQAAQMVQSSYGGHLPHDQRQLETLPGVGANTAGAIRAYAFNEPAVFIETNVRTVFIHHFFPGVDRVSDKDLLPLVEASLPSDVRMWYWALMDYGTYLKQTAGNASKQSATYSKQSKFEGSRRQIRGHVLRLLAEGPYSLEQLGQVIADERLRHVLADLEYEGFVEQVGEHYQLYT